MKLVFESISLDDENCDGCQANAASGVAVDDDCKVKFLELKRKKAYRYIILKMDQAAQKITVEKTGGPDESYEDFTNSLPEKDCRYAVYDFDFVTEDNCQKSKIFFIAWWVFIIIMFIIFGLGMFYHFFKSYIIVS